MAFKKIHWNYIDYVTQLLIRPRGNAEILMLNL